jgi:hypothetical protein
LKDFLCNDFSKDTPKYPLPRYGIMLYPFFEFDWRYLDDPSNDDHDWANCLKRIPLGNDFVFTTGGELRFRYSAEHDSRLTGRTNDYDLTRTRLYGDLWYDDLIRVFVEYIDAQTFNEALTPFPFDHNHGDLLNAFADVHLGNLNEGPVYLRLGRQQLAYGSQRLLSISPWANSERTFQGAKAFWRGGDVDVDAFVVQPIVPNVDHFDTVDDQQVFSGLWTTFHGEGKQAIDLYYLNLDQARHVALGSNHTLGAFNTSTFGGRAVGDVYNFLYDFEAMLQFGPYANQSTLAEAATAGIGWLFREVPMMPQFWMYFDFASGDPRPGEGGTHRTFNQLFPFGHYYFGYVDVVGRQNIEDINCQFSLYPTKWLTLLMQYHNFRLADARDALYNSVGTPIRRDPTGRAGTDVGDEFDFSLNFHLTTHQDLYFDYSHLHAGEFIRRTGSPLSPDYLYLQYSFRW